MTNMPKDLETTGQFAVFQGGEGGITRLTMVGHGRKRRGSKIKLEYVEDE